MKRLVITAAVVCGAILAWLAMFVVVISRWEGILHGF